MQHAVAPFPNAIGIPGEHDYSATGVDARKVGFWGFLGSECLFFGSLISAYLLFRSRGAEGTRPIDVFDIPATAASTFILLMSSLTMALALHAIRRGDMQRFKVLLVGTALLGAAFVGGQAYEFTVFTEEGVNLSNSVAGSAFYLLTGFHGIHVTVGVLWLLMLAGMTRTGRITAENTIEVELAHLYWTFVDVVWMVVFTVVYLIPV